MESPFAFVPPCSFTTQSYILRSKSLLVDLGQAWRRSHDTKGRGGGEEEGVFPLVRAYLVVKTRCPPPLASNYDDPSALWFSFNGYSTFKTCFLQKNKNLRTRRHKPIPQDND